eukprot:1201552-Rhodomonas_salina.1
MRRDVLRLPLRSTFNLPEMLGPLANRCSRPLCAHVQSQMIRCWSLRVPRGLCGVITAVTYPDGRLGCGLRRDGAVGSVG